jgi:predicted amidophosphoribosyltransferase
LNKDLACTGNETILIVDDITTTWSTINELAKLIRHHYPTIKVRGMVVWRHMS